MTSLYHMSTYIQQSLKPRPSLNFSVLIINKFPVAGNQHVIANRQGPSLAPQIKGPHEYFVFHAINVV